MQCALEILKHHWWGATRGRAYFGTLRTTAWLLAHGGSPDTTGSSPHMSRRLQLVASTLMNSKSRYERSKWPDEMLINAYRYQDNFE